MHEAHELGGRLVERLSGALFVSMPGRGPVTSGGVLVRGGDGAWTLSLFAAMNIKDDRDRLTATASVSPLPGQPPSPAATAPSASAVDGGELRG